MGRCRDRFCGVTSEVLEPRTHLSADSQFGPDVFVNGLSHVTSRGTLIIEGGGGDDLIHVRVGPKAFAIESDPTVIFADVPRAGVKRILIEGRRGNDRIGITGLPGVPVTILGGNGDDRITGGEGVETIAGGAGNDKIDAGEDVVHVFDVHGVIKSGTMTLDPVPGSLLIGGAGDDVIVDSSALDSISGGEGYDLLYVRDPVPASIQIDQLNVAVSIEEIHGKSIDGTPILEGGFRVSEGGLK